MGFIKQWKSFCYKGVLAGSIQGNQIGGQLYYSAKQGVSIDLPTPYYFSMGAPQLIQMYTVTQPEVTVNNQVILVVKNQTIMLTKLEKYHLLPLFQNSLNVQQLITLTNRTIVIPNFNTTYEYYLGNISLEIQFPECEYNQSCTDTVFTYSVLTQDLKSLPATIFKFIPSTRKLYVQSINKTVAGIYDLIYKCSVQDGFSNNQSFTINIKWDGRDLDPKPNTSTNTNTSTSLYLPNYAPQFYEKPRDIVIIAGAQASLTLPDYYDPNPNDKVTVKFETPERYKQYFRLQNQNTIVFDAGFPELGDQYLIITLKDNNPTNPKESKYLIKATFIQNDNFEMENSNVINQSTNDIFIIRQDSAKYSSSRSKRFYESKHQSIYDFKLENASSDQPPRQ
eukprot:403349016